LSLTPENLGEALKQVGLLDYFSSDSLIPLVRFTQKMLEINENLNLTRWTEDEEVLHHHLLDSAHALPLLKPLVAPGQKGMDLGTGCGFPGAVLAAAFPQMEFTLMDSVAKKTKALAECVTAAGWTTKTLTARAEELGRNPDTRESWDLVTVRAVADFRVALEYALPLLKTGGYLVNWMTEDQLAVVDKAEHALAELRGKILKRADYSLPGLSQRRWLVLVEKTGITPPTYPRAVGVPSKKPL
jgi:16S rRNA (guanine527-N7)-methyltransferase